MNSYKKTFSNLKKIKYMKTSNKMLIGLAVMIVLLTIYQLVTLKRFSDEVKAEMNKTVQESVISE